MKKKVSFCLIFILSSLLIACTQSESPPIDKDPFGILPNMLVEVEGQVELRRTGWSNFVFAGFGTLVSPGDLLRLPVGNHAAIFCGDESTWDSGPIELIADGKEHGIPCNSDHSPRPWPDTASLRGEDTLLVPYVILPRNSALLNSQPNLRWNTLTNIRTYTIALISDDNKERTPIQAAGGEIEWPENWASLEYQANYVLVVEGGNRLSNENNTDNLGLGFWLLSKEKTEEVKSLESRLQSLAISQDTADMLIAELYMEYGLYNEAARLLESLLNRSEYSSVWLGLGRAYLKTGLESEAYNAFNNARDCSSSCGEREIEADALVGMGLTGQSLEDSNQIEYYFKKAMAIYEQIGHQDGIYQIERMIQN